MDQSEPVKDPVAYCRMYEGGRPEIKPHKDLLDDIIAKSSSRLGITPRSSYHVFREVRLMKGKQYKGDMDIAIFSDSGVWHAIEAKNSTKKKRARYDLRGQLRRDYHHFGKRFGLRLTLIGVHRIRGSKEFKSFVYEYPKKR